jgi:hypothetical protein
MLAGVEEAVHAGKPESGMSAVESLLGGLIDYAGLYPPASLDMRRAVENYRSYRNSAHAFALGRFIVDSDRIDEFLAATESAQHPGLSVILSQSVDSEGLRRLIEKGARIEAIEMKATSRADVERISRTLPEGLETWFEVPIEPIQRDALCAISAAGGRAKLRTGGVTPDAFPSTEAVARAVMAYARAGLAFKATAGLHHPIRSNHPFTYSHDSQAGMMHGFVNLACASALIHFGGEANEAAELLEEQDPGEFRLTRHAISWRTHNWSSKQLIETRKRFFRSFGSCSFEEPMRDLEAMGWL